MKKSLLLAAAAFATSIPLAAQDAEQEGAPSPNQIVEAAAESEWVQIAAKDLIVMTLAPDAAGEPREVIIQLIPAPFSQGWVENIRTLARAGWYDNITVNRVQDNYVVQWGDPNYDNPEAEGEAKPLPEGLNIIDEKQYAPNVPLRSFDLTDGLFRRDAYAERVGFISGLPVGYRIYSPPPGAKLEEFLTQAWPIHCYGMVGVGRSYSPDTGSGAELYTVIGHAPRHLDRNIALVGRIISGMEHLSSLPRGSGALGFYTKEEADKRTPILSVRIASDLPEIEQPLFEYLSTESESFAKYADARANRRDPFFIKPAGGADICNIPVPVRPSPNG